MAKKLVYNYTFTPGGAGAGTLVMKGNWKERSIQLITNVTDNIIIYNFAESGSGGTTTYNSSSGETTLTFDKDTSSMSASDELQIFVDQEYDEIEFGVGIHGEPGRKREIFTIIFNFPNFGYFNS